VEKSRVLLEKKVNVEMLM